MIDDKKTLAIVTFAVVWLLGAATAGAEQNHLYDWSSSEAPVLVETDQGLIFLGQDREPWRAYQWNRAGGEKQEGSFMVDMDDDGETEIVGAGDPTFKLDQNSNPDWSLEEGCDQVIVANFAADDKLDVMCKSGSEIAIYTHDRQKIWSGDMGVNLEWCRAGDINGDLQNDLECKYRGRDTYVRIDSEGEILASESKETEIPDDAVDLAEPSPVGETVLNGEREFDLNGDGTAEETLKADGQAVVIQSRSKDKAVARMELDGEPKTAIIKDLDGKGTPEIVVLTGSNIVVANGKGEKLGTYSSDASDYSRYPVASLDSVYARGFKETKQAQKTVKDAKAELAECYERRVRGTLVVGIGQVIWKVYVDGDGKVSGTEKMHSSLNDDQIEKCALDVLEGLDYPAAKSSKDKEGEAKGTLNITLKFTFADEQ